MFCTNCGKELADNAKFCPSCGTPVAQPEAPKEQDTPPEPIQFPGAGSPAPESAAPEAPVFGGADPVEGSPAAEKDSPETGAPVYAPPAPPAEEGGQSQPIKRRGKAGLVVLGAGAVVLVLLVVLLIKLLSGLGGGGKAAAYAYLNDDGELMYLADLKEKTKALEITDEGSYASDVRFSSDGKTVYFTDDGNTLYSIAVSELKKGGKPERISRNVSSFFVLDDGRLAYSEYDGSENKLSIYEKGESYRLLKGYSDYRFSEDQKTIYYTEQDSADNTTDLYRMPVQKDAEEERLLKGASIIYNSYTSDTLVYGVQEASDTPGGGYTVTVYSCAPGGEKTKLVSGARSIQGVKVEDGKVSFYYYEEKAEEHTLYDFVTDSKASEDASTLSGERPTNPSWYDYYPSDYRVEDDGSVTYGDRSGNRYPVDVSSLLTDGKTVNDLYTWEVSPLAEADARERYDQVQADYDARIGAWNEAQERQNTREELKEYDYSQSYLELYHYTGSDKSDPIGTEIDSNGSASAAFNGVFLYRKVDMAGGKVGDLSELSYAMEVLEKLESGEGGDSDWYQNVGGKESVLEELEDIASVNAIRVLNDKEVVLSVSDGTDDILQSYALGKDALTFTATILEEDFSYPEPAEASGTDVLYLFTEPNYEDYGTTGDFCIYKDGKLETIAQEVYGVTIVDESGATYLITDFDSSGNAEVATLKDGKTTTIADEMSSALILDTAQILYLSDGDLMLWDGKESRQIARDVERVWVSNEASYTSYAPN